MQEIIRLFSPINISNKKKHGMVSFEHLYLYTMFMGISFPFIKAKGKELKFKIVTSGESIIKLRYHDY